MNMKPKKPVKANDHDNNVRYRITIEALKDGRSELKANGVNQNLAGLKLIEKELLTHLSLIQEQKIGMMIEAKTQPKIKIAPANAMHIPRNLS